MDMTKFKKKETKKDQNKIKQKLRDQSVNNQKITRRTNRECKRAKYHLDDNMGH